MNVTQMLPVYTEWISLEQLCPEEFLQQQPLPPFNKDILDFLSDVSKTLFKIPDVKQHPETVSLAHWLRKANMQTISGEFLSTVGDNELVMPRGMVFHVTPSNVDTIFLYSWALSMIAGNLNIVRVSQTVNPQLEALFTALEAVMKKPEWHTIAGQNLVISYAHDDTISRFLSSHADARMLWGGDATVQYIRSLPAKPVTKDIVFSDKISYTVINAERYTRLDEGRAKQIAQLFYNDAYQFDQMACSSPRFVYFTGRNKKCIPASERFWKLLALEMQRRQHRDGISVAVEKLVFTYQLAGQGIKMQPPAGRQSSIPTVVRIPLAEVPSCRQTCGGGFFFECFIEKADELLTIVQPNDQTLSYIEFSQKEMKKTARLLCTKGISRIVPVGQSLMFSPVWDGYVLLSELTKRVSVL